MRGALGRRAPARLPRVGARARAASSCCSTSRPRSSTPTRPRRSSSSRCASGAAVARLGAAAGARRSTLPTASLFLERTVASRRDARRRARVAREHRPRWLEPADRASAEPGQSRAGSTDVSFAYGERARARRSRRSTLRRGEVVALDGPERLREDDARQARGRSARARRRDASSARAAPRYLLQDPGRYLVRERADEEVALARRRRRRRARARARRASGSRGFEARHPRDLSSGERERLALAAVLVAEPDLLVLDEPTRGVDPGAEGRARRAAPRATRRARGDARRHARPTSSPARSPTASSRSRRAGARACLGRAGSSRSRRASRAAAWTALEPGRRGALAPPRRRRR